jgi:hypothetical protein
MCSSLVLLGELSGGEAPLDFFAAKHGWTLECVRSLDALKVLSNERDVRGVLFSPRNLAMPWERALELVVKTVPKALPIICHGFAENVPWTEAAAAGAFLPLWLPLHPDEVKQCMGFVAERLISVAKRWVPVEVRSTRPCRGPNLLMDSESERKSRIDRNDTHNVLTDLLRSGNSGISLANEARRDQQRGGIKLSRLTLSGPKARPGGLPANCRNRRGGWFPPSRPPSPAALRDRSSIPGSRLVPETGQDLPIISPVRLYPSMLRFADCANPLDNPWQG